MALPTGMEHKLLAIEGSVRAAGEACRAFSLGRDEGALMSHFAAWEEARQSYLVELAQSDQEIGEEQLVDLQEHVEAMLRAAQVGDYAEFISRSSRALAALPGEPTIPLKPPKPKPKPRAQQR